MSLVDGFEILVKNGSTEKFGWSAMPGDKEKALLFD